MAEDLPLGDSIFNLKNIVLFLGVLLVLTPIFADILSASLYYKKSGDNKRLLDSTIGVFLAADRAIVHRLKVATDDDLFVARDTAYYTVIVLASLLFFTFIFSSIIRLINPVYNNYFLAVLLALLTLAFSEFAYAKLVHNEVIIPFTGLYLLFKYYVAFASAYKV